MTPEDRERRLQIIRERCKELLAAGWFEKADVDDVALWIKNGYSLFAIQGILWECYQDYRESRSVVPFVAKQEVK